MRDEGTEEVSSNASAPYSLQTRLREETEAPFRKVRMFVYAGSAASAGVGAFIAALRVVAALVGVSGVQPLAETVRCTHGLCSYFVGNGVLRNT